jgi:flagellar M-ring protein FliF
VAGNQPSFLNQLTAIWARLQPVQRATVGLVTILVLLGLGSIVFFMNRVEYVVLYRDLKPEDAQAIAARLKELKRDFQVSADGTMIEVAGAQSDVDKLRLEIAGTGLARSGRVGYELFDKSPFGMTDFTEQVNYKRALEGELSRTISSLAEIMESRVHLVLPQDSLFIDKKQEAKGSVFVRLKRGAELSHSSISGIVNLVAGAVEGLRTNSVSVVDEKGTVLSRLSAGDGTHSEYESGIQAQMEKELVAKVTSILEPVIGKGKVHANASVEIDFNSSEQTEETYSPTPPPVILSQQKIEERVGGGELASGIPGTRSNQGDAAVQPQPGAPDRSRNSEVTNYEVNKLVRHTVQPKGSVDRLSVAVLLDYKTVFSKDAEGKQVVSFQPHADNELNKYRDLVLAAVGYNEERGDTVTLESIPFFTEPALDEPQASVPWYIQWHPYLMPAMKYTAFLALFLLAYMLLVRPVRNRMFQIIAAAPPALPQGKARQIEDGGGKTLKGTQGMQSLPTVSATNPAATPDIEQELLQESELANAGFRKYDVLKKKVVEHAQNDPEQMSQLIRAWIHEKP